jgi:nucleoside-diphosphate-sugar epimerase
MYYPALPFRHQEQSVTVLLTGLGYIGARLALDLLDRGERIVAVENFFCTARRDLGDLLARPDLQLVRGSISSEATWRRMAQLGPYSALVHLAAQPSAHPAAASIHYSELTNLVGARRTLEAALDLKVERVVLGGSFRVYGDRLPRRVSESQPYGTVGDLAHLSKIYVEKLAEMLGATRGLRCVSVRLGITYGRGPVFKTDPRFMTVPNRFCQLASSGQPLTIHPGAVHPAGFIHLDDASRALLAALELPLEQPYRPVNAVSECLTVGQVAELVCRTARGRGLTPRVSGSSQAAPEPIEVESSLSDLSVGCRVMEDSLGEVLDLFLQPG